MTVITKKKWIKAWLSPEGQKALDEYENALGKYKKIQSLEDGKTYKVPTRQILIYGIKGTDLSKYPEWEEENDN
jgi:hypothetical protein